MSLPEGNDEVRHARSLPATPNDEHASHFQPASSNDEQAGNDDQVSHSQPETSNKNTSKGNCPCSMKYLKPLDISFTDSKRKLFKESQFLSLLEGMLKGELRENSSNLTLNICKKYTDKKFMLNEGTFISFCVTEVANVLGIRPTGNSMLSKSFKFPTYIDDLKQRYSAKLNNKEKKIKEIRQR